MPVSSSTGNFDVSSRQGGLVTDGDFLQRKEVPGFAPQPFSFEQPGAQIKPPPKSNKHFNTNHNITFSTNQVLFLNDTYRRESMSKVFWDDIYGKTHGPGSTPQMRSNIQPLATPDLRQILRPTRSIAEYQPTPLEKRRRMLDLCYNSNLVLGSEPESARFATTYGELCAEAGTVEQRLDAIKIMEHSTASIKHYDVFTHKQSVDPMYGKTRFPIRSSPGITEFKGPRDCNAIRMWHAFSTTNYR